MEDISVISAEANLHHYSQLITVDLKNKTYFTSKYWFIREQQRIARNGRELQLGHAGYVKAQAILENKGRKCSFTEESGS